MVIKCKKNYYDILGVTPDSDENEVKNSYRKLARKYHPDINKSPESTVKFKDILEAYETLSDITKRKQYDMLNGFYKTPKGYFKETYSKKQSSEKSDSFVKKEQKTNKGGITLLFILRVFCVGFPVTVTKLLCPSQYL